ncbi:MAG: hypothetical protein R3B45_16355 [Bdellovibrionota bacterium]
MKFLLASLLSIFSQLCLANEALIRLEAPIDIIKFYTISVQIGIGYSDGGSGYVSFSLDELGEGVNTKTLRLRDDANLSSCTYEWIFLNDPARRPGGAGPKNMPKLIFPKIKENRIKGNCELRNSLISINTGDYTVDLLNVTINKEALENRSSHLLIGKIKIQDSLGDFEKGLSFHRKINEEFPISLGMYLFNSGNLNFNVLTRWVGRGTSVDEQFATTSLNITIE